MRSKFKHWVCAILFLCSGLTWATSDLDFSRSLLIKYAVIFPGGYQSFLRRQIQKGTTVNSASEQAVFLNWMVEQIRVKGRWQGLGFYSRLAIVSILSSGLLQMSPDLADPVARVFDDELKAFLNRTELKEIIERRRSGTLDDEFKRQSLYAWFEALALWQLEETYLRRVVVVFDNVQKMTHIDDIYSLPDEVRTYILLNLVRNTQTVSVHESHLGGVMPIVNAAGKLLQTDDFNIQSALHTMQNPPSFCSLPFIKTPKKKKKK